MFATLAGGYPWPADLTPAEALAAVVEVQVDAGLGLLSDGRVHPATSTPEDLVAAWRSARLAAEGVAPALPVKLAISGPWVSGGMSGAGDVALALRSCLVALAGAGCPLVEIHEPVPSLPSDDAGRLAFGAAHTLMLEGLAGSIHASLATTNGDAMGLGAEALFAAPYRSHLFDLVAGPESWRLVAEAPGERGIVAGAGDATGRQRTRLEDLVWAAGYAASTRGRGIARVGLAPSGGLEGLPPERARSILELLGEAAATIAGRRDDMLARLDPRAIDARTAALGQYQRRRGHRRD